MEIIRMTATHTAKLAELETLCFSEPWSEKALSEEIDNPAAYFVIESLRYRSHSMFSLHMWYG